MSPPTAGCPGCSTELPSAGGVTCAGCGLHLTDAAVTELHELADELARLTERREQLWASLGLAAPPAPPAPPIPPIPPGPADPGALAALPPPAPPPRALPVWEAAGAAARGGTHLPVTRSRHGGPGGGPPPGQPGAPPPPAGTPYADAPPPAGTSRRPGAPPPPPAPRRPVRTPQALLAIAGAVLLGTAAVVFVAAVWIVLGPLAQATVLLGVTVAVVAAAPALVRRGLPAAGGGLGLTAMVVVGVDVVALERALPLTFDVLTLPLVLAAATVAGLALHTTRVPWVGTTASITAALTAVTLTLVMFEPGLPGPGGAALVGSAAALLLLVAATVWPTVTGRSLAAGAGITWLTVAGTIAVVALGTGDTGLLLGTLGITIPVVASAVGGPYRTPWRLLPTSLLASTGLVATAARIEALPIPADSVAAVLLAGVLWLVTALPTDHRTPVGLGALPVGVIGTVAALGWIGGALERFAAVTGARTVPEVDGWALLAAVAVLAALAASPWVRQRWSGPFAVTALILLPALPGPFVWATLLLAATTLAAGCLWRRVPATAAVGLALAATAWASAWPSAVATAAGSAAVLAITAASATTAWRRGALVAVGSLAAALATGSAGSALAWPWDLTAAAVVVVVLALALGLAATRVEHPPVASGAVALLTPPVLALTTSQRVGGVVLLVAAGGWLALAALGWPVLVWAAVGLASFGTALLLDAAGIGLIEAYTVVPTLAASAIGLVWLHRDPEQRTVIALGPALLVGLGPSLLELTADPSVLPRLLALLTAAALLGAVGAVRRWRAPLLGGVVTAVWVGALQLLVLVRTVHPWITFAVAGALFVWLAATYERQQQLARRARAQLHRWR